MTDTLPHDIETEQSLVGAALLSPEFLDRVIPIVTPEHFWGDAPKQVYAAMVALREDGQEYDASTVRAWLNDHKTLQRVGGVEYLARLVGEVPMRANVEQMAIRIRDKWRLRQLIATCRRVYSEAHRADEPDAFIDGAERDLLAATQRYTIVKPQRLKDVIRERFRRMRDSAAMQAQRIRTGLADVDSVLVGLEPGDLCYLAARPGSGKTAMALNNVAASTAARGIGVGVFSLEMPREQLADRVACSAAQVDSRLLRLGKLDADDWRRLTVAVQDLGRLPIEVDDESSITAAALRAKARRMASGFARSETPLGLVVVDYLQLMGTDPKLRSRDEKVGENSKQLKALAKDLKIAVLCLCQMNRDVERRGKSAKPQLSDLRESGNIEQDADVVMFLHPKDDGVQEVIVAKNRNGPTGAASVAWRKVFTRFDDLDPDEYEQARSGW